MRSGKLVDIDATTELLKPEFSKYQKQGINMFVIDGFPRSKRILDDWYNGMSQNEYIIPFIIELDCPENIMCQRLKARNRDDDTEQAIKERYVFKNTIRTYIEYKKHL